MTLPNDPPGGARVNSLSYKFERLREKLRNGIASGEISGKLPGERILAERYHVNAKTLSKALTDLAAEGLLERSIGRGTFVKGHEPARGESRWLLLCDEGQTHSPFVMLMKKARPELEVLTDVTNIRPSFLGNFDAVIDLAKNTPAEFLRQLAVRNLPVVAIGKLPKTFSTHAVLFDGQMATSQAARDLILAGHSHLAAIEPPGAGVVASTMVGVKNRFDADVTVEVGGPSDVATLLEHGVTAFICQSCELAEMVCAQLDKLGVHAPDGVSLMAIGASSDTQPCSGYYVNRQEKVNSIVELLADKQVTRPTTLWLAGKFVDRGTTGAAPGMRHLQRHASENRHVHARTDA